MFSSCFSGEECDTQGDRDLRAINMLSELKQLPLRNPKQGYLNILRHVGSLCYSWLFLTLYQILFQSCYVTGRTPLSQCCLLSCSPGVLSNRQISKCAQLICIETGVKTYGAQAPKNCGFQRLEGQHSECSCMAGNHAESDLCYADISVKVTLYISHI